jgi:hypothetical protein
MIVGMASQRPGVHAVHAWRIDYRVGGRHYSVVYPNGPEICVGMKDCPTS